MALTPSVIGLTSTPFTTRLSPDLVALYSLSVGATPHELDLFYEARGPKVLPTLSVIAAYEPVTTLLDTLGVGFDKVVHGHQKVTAHKPLRASGTLVTTAQITAVYDLKKMAQVIVTTSSLDPEENTVVCETEWGIIVLDSGGWGGEPPPARDPGPPKRAPDAVITEATRPEQALFYRLLGDKNPLHIDPDFSLVRERFDGRPILHGLCTYGFAARAVVNSVCHTDSHRLASLSARMSRPVWPGDTLRTDLWIDGSTGWFRTAVTHRDDPVLTHGRFSLTSENTL